MAGPSYIVYPLIYLFTYVGQGQMSHRESGICGFPAGTRRWSFAQDLPRGDVPLCRRQHGFLRFAGRAGSVFEAMRQTWNLILVARLGDGKVEGHM